MKFEDNELCNPDVQVYAIVRILVEAGKTTREAHELAMQVLDIPPKKKRIELKLVVDNG